MIGSRSFAGFFGGIVVIVLVGLLGLGWFAGAIVRPAADSAEIVTFTIAPGEGAASVVDRLYEEGLVRSPLAFRLYLRANDWARSIQAGTYTLERNLNSRELVRVLIAGEGGAEERTIKILEGWSLDDVATYFEEEGVVDAEEFMAAAERVSDRADFSALADRPGAAGLEGYLFPDTYRIFADATAEEIILKMLSTFEAKLTPELRAAIDRRDQSIFDTVIMASILEREIAIENDLPVAADVFYKRLADGQALQSDATLNYVLPRDERTPRLTFDLLEHPSRYNTYKYQGLPPGPIGNPGLASLKAAALPRANPFYYFLTDSQGNTHFAETYEGHLRNRRLYLE